jgi:uncharacterized ion transporter superfamily protein YfcC
MSTLVALFIVEGLVTLLFLALVFYRSRIARRDTDWIPLSDDAREEKAIEAQKVNEAKIRKLDLPVRLLGILWVIMVLVIIGFWFYHGITTPPPITK